MIKKSTVFVTVLLAITVFCLASCSSPDEINSDLYKKGIAAYESGDYELALSYFEKIVEYEDAAIYIDSIILKNVTQVTTTEGTSTSIENSSQDITTSTTTEEPTESPYIYTTLDLGPARFDLVYMNANREKDFIVPGTNGEKYPFTEQFLDFEKTRFGNGLIIDQFILKKDGEIITANFNIINPTETAINSHLYIEIASDESAILDKVLTDRYEFLPNEICTVTYRRVITGMDVNIEKAAFEMR